MAKKSFQEHFHLDREMIRPAFYQVFTRYLTCLCFSLLWDFFFNKNGFRSKSTAFVFFVAYFGIMAWLAYLRMDGVSVPKFDRKLFTRKKRPIIQTYADMIDFTDEDIVRYEDLDEEDQDRCLLLSNSITALLFLVTALLFP